MLQPLLLFCFLLPILFIFFKPKPKPKSNTNSPPKPYPLIGHYLSIYTNRHRLVQWTSNAILNSPSSTFLLHRPFNETRVITGNPSVVQHILKTKFLNYQKGDIFRTTLFDLLGHGIFNVDGSAWKLQRQLSSHEFNTKSLKHFVEHIVISFILAGRDTTSAALTWFFWLVFKNPEVENKIVKEVDEKSDSAIYDEVKEMVYTHASLCESMRLYPPVPVDSKAASDDDVLPDGTVVKKGMMISYHPYAMGRMEKLWGGDWMEFRPERWLEKDETTGNVRIKPMDPYTYPVFQAGPRICLGKDMAFLQMKRVVSGVLRQFKVVPMADDGVEPVFVAALTSKMKGGFPVKIKERK